MEQKSENGSPRVFSIQEVADQLRVCATTVRRMLRSGELRGTRIRKVWRISAQEIDLVLGDRASR